MEKIIIKEAKLSDTSSFYSLFKVCVKSQFPEYSPKAINLFLNKYFAKKVIANDLKRKTIFLLLAFVQKRVVGYVLGLSPYGGVSYISWISVEDSFQGEGVGTALLEGYEALARKKGIHKIHLWTTKKNIKFYKRNGWTYLGCIPQNYFGVDDCLFYKSVQASKY